MELNVFLEKILPSAIVAFFVSIVWAAIHDSAKTRRSFILSTANELKAALKEAMKEGHAFWLSDAPDKSLQRHSIIALQSEIVALVSLLEKFGYDPGQIRENLCDSLTGGDFDADGCSNPNAANSLNSNGIELLSSIDEFLITLIKRPLVRLITAPFRRAKQIWNKALN